MKTKNHYLQVLLMALCIVVISPLYAAPTFKITNLEPINQSIKIGKHYYHYKDTIRKEDVGQHIHWDTTLVNQTVRIMCIGSSLDCVKPSFTYSLNYDKKNNIKDGSKVGLFGKGVTGEPVVLWRDSLIAIDEIALKDGFDYYCSIPNNTRTPKLVKKDGKLYLKSKDFRDFGAEIRLEIYSIRVEDGDKQTLMFLDVEQVK